MDGFWFSQIFGIFTNSQISWRWRKNCSYLTDALPVPCWDKKSLSTTSAKPRKLPHTKRNITFHSHSRIPQASIKCRCLSNGSKQPNLRSKFHELEIVHLFKTEDRLLDTKQSCSWTDVPECSIVCVKDEQTTEKRFPMNLYWMMLNRCILRRSFRDLRNVRSYCPRVTAPDPSLESGTPACGLDQPANIGISPWTARFDNAKVSPADNCSARFASLLVPSCPGTVSNPGWRSPTSRSRSSKRPS